MSKWTKHKDKWSSCKLCELCETRNKVVLLRGKIPCDILFIGEAPGTTENLRGQPFRGPAGVDLNQMIADSISSSYRLAFTNLIGCIPLDIDGKKVKDPDKEHIMACAPRLQEIYDIAKPTAVVMVGKLAETYVPKLIKGLTELGVGIIHPAGIRRMDVSQQGLAIQQTKVRLRDISEVAKEVIPF